MLLSHNRLVQLVEDGVINAPIENINGTSIDITLGNEIMVELVTHSSSLTQTINLKGKESLYMEEIKLWDMTDEGYILRPNEFILATSAETFNLPNNISAEYKLKSSLARSGLQHMLAGWCDPGWTNSKLTLELKNVTQYHNLILIPGMKIGQMVFWESEPVPDKANYSNTGQYNNQSTVTGNKGVK